VGLAGCLVILTAALTHVAVSRHERSALPASVGSIDLAPAPTAVARPLPGDASPSGPGSGAALHVPVYPAVQVATPTRPRPVQVGIASVHLFVMVDPVGVRPDGSLQIPSDVRRAGWYRFGSAPGDATGAVVVVGHVDSRTQGLGRFAALASVDVGDVVQVRVTSGRTYAYRVVARSLLAKRSLPVNQIFGAGGRPRLSLVTCGGPYVRAKGGYQDNLVVTAVPIGSS
jgi:hypothetical protein